MSSADILPLVLRAINAHPEALLRSSTIAARTRSRGAPGYPAHQAAADEALSAALATLQVCRFWKGHATPVVLRAHVHRALLQTRV